jgi:catechol 2,3-dioxygenase-like lactoylglutathione lyase family enzyme
MNPNQFPAQFMTTMYRVSNLERSLEWYRTMLDMKVVYRDPHYPLVSLTKGNGGRFTLWELESHAPLNTAQDTGAIVVFSSSNARGDHTILKKRGADVEPLFEIQGFLAFHATDPDGNEILIIEYKPD